MNERQSTFGWSNSSRVSACQRLPLVACSYTRVHGEVDMANPVSLETPVDETRLSPIRRSNARQTRDSPNHLGHPLTYSGSLERPKNKANTRTARLITPRNTPSGGHEQTILPVYHTRTVRCVPCARRDISHMRARRNRSPLLCLEHAVGIVVKPAECPTFGHSGVSKELLLVLPEQRFWRTIARAMTIIEHLVASL